MEQEVWRTLYLRTVPVKITDDSEHLGPLSTRHAPSRSVITCVRGTGWRDIAHRSVHPFTYATSYTILRSSCIPNDLRRSLKPWSQIRGDGILTDQFISSTGLQDLSYPGGPRQQKIDNIDLYLDYVENEWMHLNRDNGLSVYNLCQCTNHYKFETLEVAGQCRKYKDFKKITLKKLLTQSKHENKRRANIVSKKENYDMEFYRSDSKC